MQRKLNERKRFFARMGSVLAASGLVLAATVGSTAALAAVGPHCGGVFPGLTPSDPVTKSASATTAEPGESITYTIAWTQNGVEEVDLVDCFRVDAGASDTLNEIVEVGNVAYSGTNDGVEQITVVIPNDPALIGHSVVDRVRCTKGCQESKSSLVSVSVVAPPEVCDDGIDNDFDGSIDEGCTSTPPGDDDDVPPGDDDVPPGDDDVPPGDDDVPPGDDDVPPGDDDVPPGDDDVPPGDDDVPPGDDDVPPGDDDVPPGDDDVPPGDDDDTEVPPGDDDTETPPGDDDTETPPGDDDDTAGGPVVDDNTDQNDDDSEGGDGTEVQGRILSRDDFVGGALAKTGGSEAFLAAVAFAFILVGATLRRAIKV